MYLRQVTVMLGLIILCMVLLGAGFFSQIGRAHV